MHNAWRHGNYFAEIDNNRLIINVTHAVITNKVNVYVFILKIPLPDRFAQTCIFAPGQIYCLSKK